jgi:hypothetical protein
MRRPRRGCGRGWAPIPLTDGPPRGQPAVDSRHDAPGHDPVVVMYATPRLDPGEPCETRHSGYVNGYADGSGNRRSQGSARPGPQSGGWQSLRPLLALRLRIFGSTPGAPMAFYITTGLPVIQSSISGSFSTSASAAATCNAGGMAFLAAGYKTGESPRAEIRELRGMTERPFGVNVFVPDRPPIDLPATRPTGSASRSSPVRSAPRDVGSSYK